MGIILIMMKITFAGLWISSASGIAGYNLYKEKLVV